MMWSKKLRRVELDLEELKMASELVVEEFYKDWGEVNIDLTDAVKGLKRVLDVMEEGR